MKPTLIIADDVKAVREQLFKALQEDFEILAEATDGINAVEMCLRWKPDLVLLDVMMPGRSGIEAARMIAKQQDPQPKIVMLSGIRDERVVLSAFQAGASDYLFKPVEEARVAKVLWACWRGSAA